MVKMITDKVKILIEYKLKTTNSSDISKIVCFDIMSKIDSSKRKISLKTFEKECNRDETVITRHIQWLIDNKIIWRSHLKYSDDDTRIALDKNGIAKVNKKDSKKKVYLYDTYEYQLHTDVNLSKLNLFIYETINSLKIEEHKTDEKYIPLLNTFNKFNINIDEAAKYLHTSNKDNKLNQLRNLYYLHFKTPFIKKGEKVNRIYSKLTDLSSDLHKFIYLNDKAVSELDAKQCQLTIISLLTQDIESEFHSIIKSGSFYKWLFLEMKKLGTIKIIKEFRNELDQTITYMGDLYMHLMDFEDEDDYKQFKGYVIASIFSNFSNGTTISKFLKEKFTTITKKLNSLKGEKTLAHYLQDLEASIWVETAIKLNEKGIFCTVKHDSLLFNINDYSVIKDELTNAYINAGFNINGYTLFNETLRTDEKMFEVKKVKIEKINDDFNEIMNKWNSEIQNNINHSEIQKELGNTDLTVYSFIHKSGERFIGIKSDFYKKYTLDKKNLNKLIKGTLKTLNGWSINNN